MTTMAARSGRWRDRVLGETGLVLGALAMGLLVLLPDAARAFDEPQVRVARLVYLQGDVTVLNADNTGGEPAQRNMPLPEGVRVQTGADGQAEVEFEDGSLVRLTPQSAVLLTRLGSGPEGSFDTQLTLLSGLVYAELRATPKFAYRIDAGGDAVTPVTNATVRILLDQPPPAVAVLDGTAHVERVGAEASGGYGLDVGAGESLRGDAAGAGRYFLSQGIEHDSWDDWNEEREQAAANDAATRTSARDGYAGDQGYGWSDLDANGTWYDTGQGPVWQPFDASLNGFDPYGFGSWVYYPGPGYVWSSGYAWGWTPFRYGSWSYYSDFGWGWTPKGGNRGAGWRRGTTINLSHVPPGYKRPLPPTPGGPVRVHPIVPVRTGPPPTGERVRVGEARQIAGLTAMPLRTVGSGYTPRGGSAVGSSLRRDFPVDRATGRPVLGTTTAVAGRRGSEAGPQRTGASQGTLPGAAVVSGPRVGAGERAPGVDGVRRGYAGRRGEAAAPVGAAPAPNSSVSGSSVASPPPTVRVHPGGRPDAGGERSFRGDGAVRSAGTPGERSVPSQPPQAVRAAPQAPVAPLRSVPQPPMPVRVAPSPPPPMRVAPVPQPSAPAPVRSVPAPPPAPSTAPASKK